LDTFLRYGLLAVFLALILTPFGFPIPEDLSLLGAGVLSKMGHADFKLALAVGYCGVIGGDLIAWYMGSRIGLHPTGLIARLVGPDDIAWISRFYRKYGAFAIVIARQFPGMRLPAFFFAGATGVKMRRFLAFDGSAACITVGVFTSLGYIFADDLSNIVAWLERVRLVGTAAFICTVGFIVWRIGRKRLRHRSNTKSS